MRLIQGLIVFLLLSTPIIGLGKIMESYDMASLYYASDVVVEVEELGYVKENYRYYGKVVCKKVYKGNFAENDTVDVSMSTVYHRFPYDKNTWCYIGRPLEMDSTIHSALLFLKKRGNEYVPVGSGIKLIYADQVFMYGQQANPGPYCLYEQKEEFTDATGQYDLTALRIDLEMAIKRVKLFEEALLSEDVLRVKAFLPFLDWQEESRDLIEHDNLLSHQAAKRLTELCDVTAIQKIIEECKENCLRVSISILEGFLEKDE